MDDEMKRELNGIKSELAKVVAGIAALTTDVADLKKGNRGIAAMAANTKAELAEFKSYAMGQFSRIMTRAELNARFEAFSRDIEAAQRDRTLVSKTHMKHQDRLDDHEKRLTRLEAKRS